MARIELDGFDELNKLLESMTLSEDDEKKAISAALVPVEAEVQKNTPVDTEKLKKSIRAQVGKEDGQMVGKIILGDYHGRFQEYGTSTQNKNVGFFARSIRKSKDEAMRILKTELVNRLK